MMNPKIQKNILLLLGILFLCYQTAIGQTQWQSVIPGLDYTTISLSEKFPWGTLHAFRIDLQKFRLELAFANDQVSHNTSARELAQKNKALIAINGGFFTPDFKPIGLRINNGKIHQQLKHTSWWGVFYIKNNQAHIVAKQQFHLNKKIDFAVQGGPRLLVNGNIPKLKPGTDERTALCITKSHKIILLATYYMPMTTTELAGLIKQPQQADGLDCYQALNLDVGNSTQMYAKIKGVNVDFSGFSKIADAILVFPK